jgi:hypothetical protein
MTMMQDSTYVPGEQGLATTEIQKLTEKTTSETLAKSIASEFLGLSPYRLREIAAHLNDIAEERDNT